MAKILVIEDEAILRREVLEWLTLEDHEAVGAADSVAGIESAFQSPPDLIICDVMMPHLDGYGVLFEIRANPSTAGIPFIFLTAKTRNEDFRIGMDLGADDYLTKPFTRMVLLNSIQARLEKIAHQEKVHHLELDRLHQALDQERDQRLLKAKFVAMFAHDFRNPLASILSSTSLVRDYADRMDDQRRMMHLNRIEASVRHLIQMVDDVLTVAQMEANRLDFKPEPLDVEQFIREIVEEFQAIYRETRSIVFESAPVGLPLADHRVLRQITANLLSNAIKYSPKETEVFVKLKSEDRCWTLVVRDEGAGVSEADQERLFIPFERGSNVKNVAGTGLGLAVVKQAVDLCGGSVKFESQINVGTTVTVVFPIHMTPPPVSGDGAPGD